MLRPFAVALVVLVFASPAVAADADIAPEKLLPPSTQLYVRWDGITAHNDAYKKSIWGGVMAGPTGDSIRTLLAQWPKNLGSPVLAEPLLEGQPPAQLKRNLADLKAAEKVVDLIADKGVIVAAEVREPMPTLKGVGKAIGGLFTGKLPGAEAVTPEVQVLVIVPDAGAKADVLFGTIRLLMRQSNYKVEAFAAGGRKGFRLAPREEGAAPYSVYAAWWVEGKHFVFYAGSRKPEAVIAEMAESVTSGGITARPLYQRARKTGDFETVTRGFVDTGRAIGMARTLAGPLVPGLRERLDSTGLSGLKAIVFASGFNGKESRALWEFDVPGERKGLTKVLKNKPLGLADLPPLPPDVTRFSALRLDFTAAYDAGISAADFLGMNSPLAVDADAKGGTALVKARTAYLRREVDKALGVTVTDDLLPHLGDKLVIFQSPSEGLSAFGTVVCVSVKDPAKVKAAIDRIQRTLGGQLGTPIKVRKKMLKGVEIRELYGLSVVTPTYAIVGEWLVIGVQPQTVQGVILRAKGVLPKWKLDAATAKRLGTMPADGCGLQYCDPKSTASNICCVGPLLLGFLGLAGGFNNAGESDFDPIDVGLVPNSHELCQHLFPNLTVTRDDGKTIRVEVNESFSLPLEFVGVEPFLLFGSFLGLRLF